MSAVERSGASGSAAGFTLLEILLVLAVLALGASLVLPALVRPSSTELRSAAADVVAGLRRARDAAVNAQRPAVLTLDLDARNFTVSGEARPRALPGRVDLKLYTARSELEGERRGRIRFYPDGSSTGGRVTLASGERRYYVDVDWLTGQVRVHAGSADDPPAPDGAQVQVGS